MKNMLRKLIYYGIIVASCSGFFTILISCHRESQYHREIYGDDFDTEAYSDRKYSPEAIEYFLEIGFGSEYFNIFVKPVVKKWQENIRIALHNDYTNEDTKEAEKIADELAYLTGLDIRVENSSRSNVNIHFIDPEEEINQLGPLARLIPSSVRFINGLVTPTWTSQQVIYKAIILIDKAIQGEQRKSILREEITQGMGLLRDSYAHKDSIFHQRSYPTKFAEIDEEVIRLLYDERIKPGMTKAQVKRVLRRYQSL